MLFDPVEVVCFQIYIIIIHFVIPLDINIQGINNYVVLTQFIWYILSSLIRGLCLANHEL